MFTIDGNTMPTPKSVVSSSNKIWSQNTGRLDSGYFVGELIAIKRKYEVTFPPLTTSELAAVKAQVNKDFASVSITDMDGNTATLTAYFGDLSVEAYSWHSGIKYAINATISIIER